MKVEVSNVSSFQRKLSITVPADDVKKELESAFRVYGKQARIKGFRPGKIPQRVLESRFGPAVREDVANRLIQTSWVKAMTEQDIEPVGQPAVDNASEVTRNSDFEFSILVDVKPEISLETYTGIEVPFPKFEVTDDEVDAQVKARLESNARLVEVTKRGVEKGDMVMVELVAKDGKEEVAREIGTMIRTEADPYYPGIEDLLVGLKTGKSKKGKITFGAEARTEEVAGRELSVEVKVVSIQANEVPELDDDIAAELDFEGGAAGMRAAIKAQLAEGRDELARNQARANMLEKLIEINPFDVPDGMIDNAQNMLVEELKLQQAYRTGADPRQIQFNAETMADLRQRAVFASKASLVLEFVSKKETIEVSDADIEARFQELADQRGQTVEAVKGWFAGEKAEDELKDRILEEKTLDWLLERCDLVDQVPGAEAEAKPAKKKAAAKKPAAKKKAAAKADKAPAKKAKAAEADVSVLAQAVGKIKTALATGDYDGQLDALEAAETAGKARKGALEAIASRR